MDAAMLPVPENSASDRGPDAYVYKYKDKAEPLFALYSRRALKPMEEMLEAGNYKLRVLLDRIDTRYMELEEDQLGFFYNCNTPEDLKKISEN